MDEALYQSLAEHYEKIYHWKDYPGEAERLIALLEREGVAAGARVLEAACGTGAHLRHLAEHFSMAGFDKHAGMLAQARGKAPETALFVADMAGFAVAGPPFDALVCLFGSIGYLSEDGALEAGLACFARALKPGGTVVVEPWLAPEVFSDGHISLHSYEDAEVSLTRMAFGRREGADSVFEFRWLVGRPGRGIESFVDHHRLRMTGREAFLGALDRAGFDGRFEADGFMRGRGLYIGRRR